VATACGRSRSTRARHGVGHVGQELVARPVDDADRHPELVQAPADLGETLQLDPGGLRASMRRIARQAHPPPGDVDLLTHMLLAAVNEAALLIARAKDPQAALQAGQAAVDALRDRLIADPPQRQPDPHRR
jgi:hypothetical protein